MKELALHILDILHNSIAAGATLVEVTVVEDTMEDILEFSITDNGKGMSPEFVQKSDRPVYHQPDHPQSGAWHPAFEAGRGGMRRRAFD